MKKIKLFCLPYAGASATVYAKWKEFTHSSIQVIPVELKGRGMRFSEGFYDSFEEAVEDIYQSIKQELDTGKYALFGHSMGSVIVHDLIAKIQNNKHPDPIHAIFSGRYPPHIRKGKNTYMYSNNKFKNEILDIGGTPEKVFADNYLRDTFIPIIRADFKIIEEREHRKNDKKYDFNISILSGINDNIATADELKQWKDYTNEKCDYFEFEGGHFFINEKFQDVVTIINSILTSV